MPGGRPTDYDEAHCETAEAYLRQGYSVAALAGHLGVAYSTVRLWEQTHPEFSAAVKRGRAGASEWWERRLRDFAETGEGNATAIIFGLKNRAPEEWRDRTEVNHGGQADGEPIRQRLDVHFHRPKE